MHINIWSTFAELNFFKIYQKTFGFLGFFLQKDALSTTVNLQSDILEECNSLWIVVL